MKRIILVAAYCALVALPIGSAHAATKNVSKTHASTHGQSAGACREEIARRGIRKGPEGLAALHRCMRGGFDKI